MLRSQHPKKNFAQKAFAGLLTVPSRRKTRESVPSDSLRGVSGERARRCGDRARTI
jgi:hypothetical protein